MGRKDLLLGLMTGAEEKGGPPARPPSEAARGGRGAIGAVSRSIADLKARALTEVPADLIDPAGLTDRLDEDEAGIAELAESIRQWGQQVPVLLRHSPNYEGRYEVVYGRRRVAALKRLGLPVRAMIRDLSDRDLIVAQGQENNARRDLSFIEKAVFAARMQRMGFDRRVICDALMVDKTQVSRMIQVAEAVPEPVIRAIGAAPSVGRTRWLALAARLEGRDAAEVAQLARGASSDARFAAVFAALAAPRPAPDVRPLTGADARPLAELRRARGRTVLSFTAAAEGFDDWLVDNLERLHREFLAGRGP